MCIIYDSWGENLVRDIWTRAATAFWLDSAVYIGKEY